MKNLKKIKTLTRNELKEITGSKLPWLDDGCPWPLCMNGFGRCSRLACNDF